MQAIDTHSLLQDTAQKYPLKVTFFKMKDDMTKGLYTLWFCFVKTHFSQEEVRFMAPAALHLKRGLGLGPTWYLLSVYSCYDLFISIEVTKAIFNFFLLMFWIVCKF